MKIVLAPQGSTRREVDVADIAIPDLWHAAGRQSTSADRDAILDCWHLLRALQDRGLRD